MSSGKSTKARRSADERRTAYLDAARRLFTEHGFAGTSTDMIVAEVGGSKATLYKYFPSKESLVAALIAGVVARVTSPDAGFGVDNVPLEEALMRIGLKTHEAVVSPAAVDALRLCLGEYGRFPELARAVWDHGPRVTYATFRQFLERRVERGELEVEDYQLASEQFLGTIAGHIQLKVSLGIVAPPNCDEAEKRVREAVRTFLARYAPRTPARPHSRLRTRGGKRSD